MADFQILVYGRTLDVQLVHKDSQSERFRITLAGKEEPAFVMECNRPYWRKKGLKKRRPDWKVVEGEVTQPKAVEKAQIAIMQHLEPPPPPKLNNDPHSRSPACSQGSRKDQQRKKGQGPTFGERSSLT